MDMGIKDLKNELGKFRKKSRVRNTNAEVLEFEHGMALKSYSSIVCIEDDKGMTYFTEHTDYSQTTRRHVSEFCGMLSEARKKALKKGTAAIIEGDPCFMLVNLLG